MCLWNLLQVVMIRSARSLVGLGLVYIELMGVRSEYLPGRDSIPRADLFLLVVVVSSSRVECTCASIISHTSRYRS